MLLRIIILLLLSIPSLSYSKNNPLDSIIINADDLLIDQATSSSVFTGHVILWFDNGLIVETDKVIVTIKEENNQKSIDKIIMPSKLKAIKDSYVITNQLSEITLIAEEGEYTEEKSELILKGNVYMKDNNNFVKCNELIYYTNIKKLSTNGR